MILRKGMHRGGSSGQLHQGDQPPQFAQDGRRASGRRAFSAKTRKVLGRWGPLGHLTHGRGSVLFVDGRRERALSLAGEGGGGHSNPAVVFPADPRI